MKLTRLFNDFFNSERAGGLILIVCTVLSLVLTNVYPAYSHLWHIEFGGEHLVHWINDGFMAIFFLLIGLELEREVYIGELSNFRNALQPLLAALGGMIFPAAIYFALNVSGGNTMGLGIPMATDIAFALGVLSLLGSRIPASLKIFLTALAVIDDLGAIIIIAVFYTDTISWLNLGIAMGIFIFLLGLNRLKVHKLMPYLVLGIFMWYFMLNSGVHATITGVLLAFAIPFGNGDENSPSYKLQHFLHKPVAFLILPLFALANTSIPVTSDFYVSLGTKISLGIMAGLLIGKPVGIVLLTWLSAKLKWSMLPEDLKWSHVIGAGFLGGIGFTMSIFISLLAFDDTDLVDESKIAIMIVSTIAGAIGYFWLKSIPAKESSEL
jgi:NhaA family Na+:H+ antiporter